MSRTHGTTILRDNSEGNNKDRGDTGKDDTTLPQGRSHSRKGLKPPIMKPPRVSPCVSWFSPTYDAPCDARTYH